VVRLSASRQQTQHQHTYRRSHRTVDRDHLAATSAR
jgi:hypothetical protein